MARPNNSIGKIKLPGENTQRPIVPYGLTDANGSYYVTLPYVASDCQFIVSNPNVAQEINNTPLTIHKYLSIYSDDMELENPYDWTDPDINIYSTNIELRDGGEDESFYRYYFPNQTGYFVVRTPDHDSQDNYFERTLLAEDLEDKSSAGANPARNWAVADGFVYNYYESGSVTPRKTSRFDFPQIGNNRATLGLQVEIDDLTNL